MLADHAEPMEMLRTAVSSDSFDDPDKNSNAEDANFAKATRLIAKMPTMVARYDRRRRGLDPIAPDRRAVPRRQLPLHADRRVGPRTARPRRSTWR